MAETLGDATLYLEIDDTPLAAGLASTEQLVNQRLQAMSAQVTQQNNLITGSFATALAQTTASIDSAFAGWTATFSAEQSALSTQSNQLFTDFTIGLLNHSTTLTTSLIAGGTTTDAWIRSSSLAMSTHSNQLFTAFTIGLLNHSTTLTTSLIAAGAATDAWIRGSSLALGGWLTTTAAGTSTHLTSLFTGFSGWLNSAFSALAASTHATANRIVGTINALASRMNQPIAAWNALSFHVPGFSHTVRVPSFTLPTGETVGGQSKSFGWGGATMQTTNTPSIASVSPIPTIIGAAVGGLFMKPSLARVADGGEPEAVIPLSRLPQFAGEAAGYAGSRQPDLHLHIENAYGIDHLIDQINEFWLDGRLRGLQDQLAGAG